MGSVSRVWAGIVRPRRFARLSIPTSPVAMSQLFRFIHSEESHWLPPRAFGGLVRTLIIPAHTLLFRHEIPSSGQSAYFVTSLLSKFPALSEVYIIDQPWPVLLVSSGTRLPLDAGSVLALRKHQGVELNQLFNAMAHLPHLRSLALELTPDMITKDFTARPLGHVHTLCVTFTGSLPSRYSILEMFTSITALQLIYSSSCITADHGENAFPGYLDTNSHKLQKLSVCWEGGDSPSRMRYIHQFLSSIHSLDLPEVTELTFLAPNLDSFVRGQLAQAHIPKLRFLRLWSTAVKLDPDRLIAVLGQRRWPLLRTVCVNKNGMRHASKGRFEGVQVALVIE